MALPATATVAPGYVPVPASDPPPETTSTILSIETTRTSTTAVISPPVDILYLPIEPAAVPVPVSTADRETVETEHVVVMPGDNMWLLAERRLRGVLGREAGDHEVAPYWLAVIGANRDRIRSGDPDLIFPGEVLVLPAWNIG
jgi:nucleoid-associated protein YgaU